MVTRKKAPQSTKKTAKKGGKKTARTTGGPVPPYGEAIRGAMARGDVQEMRSAAASATQMAVGRAVSTFSTRGCDQKVRLICVFVCH